MNYTKKEFIIKRDFTKYKNWIVNLINEELKDHNYIELKDLKYLISQNDIIHLHCLNLLYIKNIALEENKSIDDLLYNLVYINNYNPLLNHNINEYNYDILLELLNHKYFTTLNKCYEKKYYYRGKEKTMKLEL